MIKSTYTHTNTHWMRSKSNKNYQYSLKTLLFPVQINFLLFLFIIYLFFLCLLQRTQTQIHFRYIFLCMSTVVCMMVVNIFVGNETIDLFIIINILWPNTWYLTKSTSHRIHCRPCIVMYWKCVAYST